MRSRISIRGYVRRSVRPSVRPSHTSWNHAKVPFSTKTTISTSENASYGRVSGRVSCILQLFILFGPTWNCHASDWWQSHQYYLFELTLCFAALVCYDNSTTYLILIQSSVETDNKQLRPVCPFVRPLVFRSVRHAFSFTLLYRYRYTGIRHQPGMISRVRD